MSDSPAVAPTDPVWERIRCEQFPVAQTWAYFDHAAVAPLPRCAADTVRELTADFEANGHAHWSGWRKRIEVVRRLGAQLLNTSSRCVAVVRNTTEGISLVAEGLDWQRGDNVVVPDGEFPSNVYPWANLAARGVELRRVSIQRGVVGMQQLDAACDQRTRLVSLSWVDFATGYRRNLADVARVCAANRCLLFVDAIQGLGVFPLDVSDIPIDFLAADGHKWLLGPEGAGLFYVRENRLSELRPLNVGWNSVRHAGDFANEAFDLKSSAARYEGGTYNMAGIAALGSSLEMWSRYHMTPDDIARRLLHVVNTVCDRLLTKNSGLTLYSQRDARPDLIGVSGHNSGIISLEYHRKSETPADCVRRCKSQHVLINQRNGRLRISPHVYNNDADIERLVKCLTN